MKSHIQIIFILNILIGLSCREEPTEPRTAEFSLIAEDIGVTDVHFRLRGTLSHGPFTIYVKRDGEQIYQSPPTNLSTIDTLLYDKNLLPKQNYTYKAYYTIGGMVHDSSTPLLVTTMDTTSHEFTWEIDTLGDGGGSILRDVCIVNDTCVWVVGEINKQFESPSYGATRWDGEQWHYYHIYANGPTGVVSNLNPSGIYSFAQNEIWLSNGGVFQWDGISNFAQAYWINDFPGNPNPILLPGQYAQKLWGSAIDDIYIIALNGGIAHYNGIHWERMESGTDVRFTDVWGSQDGSVVWTCGYYPAKPGTYLLRCTNNSWSIAVDGTELENSIKQDSLSGPYTCVYTPSNLRLYVGSSSGLYAARSNTRGEGERYSFTSTYFPGFPNSLRGNRVNDMVIVGDYSMVAHFNGITWRYFNELRTNNIALLSVAQRGDLIVAVGELYHPWDSKGIVFIGRR